VTLAGSIQVDLFHFAGHANQVKITSSRPDSATRVLLGKTPEQVLNIVPLLFSLCGNAQAYAALQACRSAMEMPAPPEIDAAQKLLVQLETLREHAWRILLDWPGFIGLSANKSVIAALLKFDGLFKRALFRNGEAFKLDSIIKIDPAQLNQLFNELETLINSAIFNDRLGGFLNLISEAQLRDWLVQNPAVPARFLSFIYQQKWQAIGQNTIACIPELAAEDVHRQMQQYGLTDFVRAPQWLGCCFESTSLNRQLAHPLMAGLHKRYGNGLVVRLMGRLVELAGIPAQLRRLQGLISEKSVGSAQPLGSKGMGMVQAGRGLLIHRLVLLRGQVNDYRIVAPTEWNFHADGVAAHSLKHLQADSIDDLNLQAELLINAIDPCVQYQLNLIDIGTGQSFTSDESA
jgi:uptake hydrogenase large subunit